MFVDIEIISGKILDLLDDKGKSDLYEIKKNINGPEEFIIHSLRWLTQTGFITEDVLTREYTTNGLQKVCKNGEMMVELASKN